MNSGPLSRMPLGKSIISFRKPWMVTPPLRMPCFRSISKESCRTNCSEFRGAGCRRSKRALPTSRKETVLGSLILRRASTSRLSGQWSDDEANVLENGVIIGRIFKVPIAPAEPLRMWASGHNGDIRRARGYEADAGEAAMPTFAKTRRNVIEKACLQGPVGSMVS